MGTDYPFSWTKTVVDHILIKKTSICVQFEEPTVGWFAHSRHPGFRPAARLVDFCERILSGCGGMSPVRQIRGARLGRVVTANWRGAGVTT